MTVSPSVFVLETYRGSNVELPAVGDPWATVVNPEMIGTVSIFDGFVLIKVPDASSTSCQSGNWGNFF